MFVLKEIRDTSDQTFTICLNRDEVVIGRRNNIGLRKYHQISKDHAVIRRMNGVHHILDISTFNNLYVNGVRVGRELRSLRIGDKVTFGKPLGDESFTCEFTECNDVVTIVDTEEETKTAPAPELNSTEVFLIDDSSNESIEIISLDLEPGDDHADQNDYCEIMEEEDLVILEKDDGNEPQFLFQKKKESQNDALINTADVKEMDLISSSSSLPQNSAGGRDSSIQVSPEDMQNQCFVSKSNSETLFIKKPPTAITIISNPPKDCLTSSKSGNLLGMSYDLPVISSVVSECLEANTRSNFLNDPSPTSRPPELSERLLKSKKGTNFLGDPSHPVSCSPECDSESNGHTNFLNKPSPRLLEQQVCSSKAYTRTGFLEDSRSAPCSSELSGCHSGSNTNASFSDKLNKTNRISFIDDPSRTVPRFTEIPDYPSEPNSRINFMNKPRFSELQLCPSKSYIETGETLSESNYSTNFLDKPSPMHRLSDLPKCSSKETNRISFIDDPSCTVLRFSKIPDYPSESKSHSNFMNKSSSVPRFSELQVCPSKSHIGLEDSRPVPLLSELPECLSESNSTNFLDRPSSHFSEVPECCFKEKSCTSYYDLLRHVPRFSKIPECPSESNTNTSFRDKPSYCPRPTKLPECPPKENSGTSYLGYPSCPSPRFSRIPECPSELNTSTNILDKPGPIRRISDPPKCSFKEKSGTSYYDPSRHVPRFSKIPASPPESNTNTSFWDKPSPCLRLSNIPECLFEENISPGFSDIRPAFVPLEHTLELNTGTRLLDDLNPDPRMTKQSERPLVSDTNPSFSESVPGTVAETDYDQNSSAVLKSSENFSLTLAVKWASAEIDMNLLNKVSEVIKSLNAANSPASKQGSGKVQTLNTAKNIGLFSLESDEDTQDALTITKNKEISSGSEDIYSPGINSKNNENEQLSVDEQQNDSFLEEYSKELSPFNSQCSESKEEIQPQSKELTTRGAEANGRNQSNHSRIASADSKQIERRPKCTEKKEKGDTPKDLFATENGELSRSTVDLSSDQLGKNNENKHSSVEIEESISSIEQHLKKPPLKSQESEPPKKMVTRSSSLKRLNTCGEEKENKSKRIKKKDTENDLSKSKNSKKERLKEKSPSKNRDSGRKKKTAAAKSRKTCGTKKKRTRGDKSNYSCEALFSDPEPYAKGCKEWLTSEPTSVKDSQNSPSKQSSNPPPTSKNEIFNSEPGSLKGFKIPKLNRVDAEKSESDQSSAKQKKTTKVPRKSEKCSSRMGFLTDANVWELKPVSRQRLNKKQAEKVEKQNVREKKQANVGRPKRGLEILSKICSKSKDSKVMATNKRVRHSSPVSNGTKRSPLMTSRLRKSVAIVQPYSGEGFQKMNERKVHLSQYFPIVQMVLEWSPVRLQKQNEPSTLIPDISKAPVCFDNYDAYFSLSQHLVTQSVWNSLCEGSKHLTCKNFQCVIKSRTEKHGLVGLECEAAVDRDVTYAPSSGDVIRLNVTNNENTIEHNVFAFITSCEPVPLSELSDAFDWQTSPLRNSANFHCFTAYVTRQTTLSTMSLLHATGVCNIQSKLHAMEYLFKFQFAPLCEVFLDPKEINLATDFTPLKKNRNSYVQAVCTEMEENLAPKVFLVQGTAEAGKTSLILELIEKLLYESSSQVFVCAPSHSTVDEICLKIVDLVERNTWRGKFVKLVRIGNVNDVHPQLRNYHLDALAKKCHRNWEIQKQDLEMRLKNLEAHTFFTELANSLEDTKKKLEEYKHSVKNWKQKVLDESSVVISTVSDFKDYNAHFPPNHVIRSTACCIVDDAGQCKEPELLQCLTSGVCNLVLVGDPDAIDDSVGVANELSIPPHHKSVFHRFHEAYKYVPQSPMLVLQN